MNVQKLNKIIDGNYIDLFNSFLLYDKNIDRDDYFKIIQSSLCSLFIQEVISNGLTEKFLNIKNLFNN
jgi:hypothetical protein